MSAQKNNHRINEIYRKVAEFNAARSNRTESLAELSDEEKQRLQELEPTDAQLALLRRFKVAEDLLLSLTRYDASELIERTIAEREIERNKPATQAQVLGLLKFPCFEEADVDDLCQLTKGEAHKLFYHLTRKRA